MGNYHTLDLCHIYSPIKSSSLSVKRAGYFCPEIISVIPLYPQNKNSVKKLHDLLKISDNILSPKSTAPNFTYKIKNFNKNYRLYFFHQG